MELKEFTKNVLKDLIDAVEEVRKGSTRDLHLASTKDTRTVEFDVAVSVENEVSGEISGEISGGIKVLSFFQIKGDTNGSTKNATISRVKFGVSIDEITKEEEKQNEIETDYAIKALTNNNQNY